MARYTVLAPLVIPAGQGYPAQYLKRGDVIECTPAQIPRGARLSRR